MVSSPNQPRHEAPSREYSHRVHTLPQLIDIGGCAAFRCFQQRQTSYHRIHTASHCVMRKLENLFPSPPFLPSSGVCEKQWKVWSSSSSSPRRTRTQWYARVCVCVCVRKSYTCPSVTSSCICFPSILIECEKSCSLWRLCHLQGSIERMVQLLCR